MAGVHEAQLSATAAVDRAMSCKSRDPHLQRRAIITE